MITLASTDDQAAISASVSSFFEKELPLSRVRELADTPDGIDDALWEQYADLGWFALGVPDQLGGIGLGACEEALLLIESGRHLAPGPLRTTILAARIAAAAGDEELVGQLVSGGIRAGLAVGELAVDVRDNDLIVVLTPTGGALHEVSNVRPSRGVDITSRVAHVDLGTAVAQADGPFLTLARILFAAEQLGVIEATRDMSAAYAQTRVQFGKPIGTFQAVKHRCADMAVAAYSVRAQVLFAAAAFDADRPDAVLQAGLAYELANTRSAKSTKDNIQNHGGIGFTWEQDSHLYLKRSHLLGRLLGTARDTHRDILAAGPHEFF